MDTTSLQPDPFMTILAVFLALWVILIPHYYGKVRAGMEHRHPETHPDIIHDVAVMVAVLWPWALVRGRIKG